MTWYDYVRAVEIAEILKNMTSQQREYVSEGLAKWAAEASEEDCRGAAADLLRAAEVLQERSQ